MSHLTQVSGLKILVYGIIDNKKNVSPYTGEWIENYARYDEERDYNVSPYTGEWIENFNLTYI